MRSTRSWSHQTTFPTSTLPLTRVSGLAATRDHGTRPSRKRCFLPKSLRARSQLHAMFYDIIGTSSRRKSPLSSHHTTRKTRSETWRISMGGATSSTGCSRPPRTSSSRSSMMCSRRTFATSLTRTGVCLAFRGSEMNGKYCRHFKKGTCKGTCANKQTNKPYLPQPKTSPGHGFHYYYHYYYYYYYYYSYYFISVSDDVVFLFLPPS